MSTITISPFKVTAPSKLILHGEHSVVYGYGAIAISVDLRMRVCVSSNNENCLKLSMPGLNLLVEWPISALSTFNLDGTKPTAPTKEVIDSLKYFLSKYTKNKLGQSQELALTCLLFLYLSILPKTLALNLTVESKTPIGCGLGSSATYAVCLSTAFLQLVYQCGTTIPEDIVTLADAWAFASESIAHGKPSGIDNSICSYGGALWFQNGKHKKLEGLSLKPRVLLVDSGVPRSTRVLVQKVAELQSEYPNIIDHIMQAIGALSEEAMQLLTSKTQVDDNFTKLEKLVDMNQSLLASLGVSHTLLDCIITICQKHGFHAKLTGAGGGGIVYVLLPRTASSDSIKNLVQHLHADGFQSWETELGTTGVQIEF